MTPERVNRLDDEGLYQPRLHSRWIRQLHLISQQLGEPMTIVLEQAVREYVERYQISKDDDESNL
ncbi:MAG: hypothetical protein PHQ43_15430 [Dehalococcoidales bacterium]|nr:hypothetical protein [Dehalococcoidales bacterium]